MGRPRVIRTPSEEREFQLRRKEMRRVRLLNQTEEQRAIMRSKQAALQRRRRQDAALRERENEARRRLRADPVIRQLEAAKQRARRADEAVRLREAEARWRRRQNPEVRQLEAAKHRERRKDIAVRLREAEANWRRRQNTEVRQLEAARHRARREDPEVRLREAQGNRRRRQNLEGAISVAQQYDYEASRELETGEDWQSRLRQRTQLSNERYACCDVCFCLAREQDLSPVNSAQLPLLIAEFPDEEVDSFLLCSLCHAAIRADAIGAPSRSNGYAHPANTAGLCEDHSFCSSDYEDSWNQVHSPTLQNCLQQTVKAKVDCCLQTDETGKVHCLVQTEDTAKSTADVPADKCTKVIAVQTEEWPWLQFCESTCGETEDESDCLRAHGINTKGSLQEQKRPQSDLVTKKAFVLYSTRPVNGHL